MDRDDFDNLPRDLLGRPLTAAEHRDLLPAIAAFRLKPGSPVAVLLVLYQALRTEVAEANAPARSVGAFAVLSASLSGQC